MATFEQMKKMFEMHEEKNHKRLDQLKKNIEKNVRETLTKEVVKNVVASLAPKIKEEVEREVKKVTEPVKKQLKKTEAEVLELRKTVETLNSKFNDKEDEMARIETEFPALPGTEAGRGERAGRGAGAGRGERAGEGLGDREGGRRQGITPAMQEKERDVRRMFQDANSTLTFSPIYKNDWETQVKTRVKEGIE